MRIIKDLDHDYFVIFVDESSDVSQNEQLGLCLGCVEQKIGKLVEGFLRFVHVSYTTTLSLKNAITLQVK